MTTYTEELNAELGEIARKVSTLPPNSDSPSFSELQTFQYALLKMRELETKRIEADDQTDAAVQVSLSIYEEWAKQMSRLASIRRRVTTEQLLGRDGARAEQEVEPLPDRQARIPDFGAIVFTEDSRRSPHRFYEQSGTTARCALCGLMLVSEDKSGQPAPLFKEKDGVLVLAAHSYHSPKRKKRMEKCVARQAPSKSAVSALLQLIEGVAQTRYRFGLRERRADWMDVNSDLLGLASGGMNRESLVVQHANRKGWPLGAAVATWICEDPDHRPAALRWILFEVSAIAGTARADEIETAMSRMGESAGPVLKQDGSVYQLPPRWC